MIRSIRDKRIFKLLADQRPKRFPADLVDRARRKLAQLNAAENLDDLKQPPSNHLEALKGDRKGQHAIRINRQFRLCFIWRNGNAEEVEIVDYH